MSEIIDRNKDAKSREHGLETRLDECFAAYRDACPDPEPSPDFNSRLWARIDSRPPRQDVFAWRRWAQAFLSLAAVTSLLIVVLQVVPPSTSAYFRSTYIEQLSEDDGPEQMLFQDVASAGARSPLQPATTLEAPLEGSSGR